MGTIGRRRFLQASAGALAASALPITSAGAEPRRVTVLHGGLVRTMAAPATTHAVAIANGVVVDVGERAMSWLGRGARGVDLDGAVVFPGFLDAHAHWFGDHAHAGFDSDVDGTRAAAAGGWTSITEHWCNPDRVARLREVGDELPLRLHAYLPAHYRDDFLGDWWRDHTHGEHLARRVRVAGAKLFVDNGPLGWTTFDYLDDPGNRGEHWWTVETLLAQLRAFDDHGLPVVAHVLGDAAATQALDAFELLLAGRPNRRRHQLTHLLLLTDEHVARLAASGLVASLQLPWFDGQWAEEVVPIIGEERLGLMSRWQDLHDAGIPITGSTDFPWGQYPGMTGAVMESVQIAVTRRSTSGLDAPAVWRAQALSVDQALRSITTGAAWALGEERRLGSVQRHRCADLTILTDDPYATQIDALAGIGVVATLVDGEVMHGALPGDPPAAAVAPVARTTSRQPCCQGAVRR